MMANAQKPLICPHQADAGRLSPGRGVAGALQNMQTSRLLTHVSQAQDPARDMGSLASGDVGRIVLHGSMSGLQMLGT